MNTPFVRQSRQEGGRRGRHGFHHCASVGLCAQGRQINASRLCHFLAADIGVNLRFSLAADVDQNSGMTAGANAFGDKGVFNALRIQSSENGYGFHDATAFRRGVTALPGNGRTSEPDDRGPSSSAANRRTSSVSAFSVGRRSIELAP